MRVLLVEDNEDLRGLFARVLRFHACEVRTASDGRAALEAVEGFVPDLVLTDLMMPVMDGVELIRRLRARPELSAVPMVAITADSTAEAERNARDAGAAEFVIKLIDIGLILARFGHDRHPLRR